MLNRRLWIGLLVWVMCAGALAGCQAASQTVPPTPTAHAPAAFTPMITPSKPGELAAKVNDQGIPRDVYELQVAQFQAAMVGQGVSFSGQEGKPLALEVRKQVLEAMIDEVVIAQAAAAQGITVTDKVLQQRIQDDIAASGGPQKFDEWLRHNGFTRETYEKLMRTQILTDEIVRRLGTKIPDTVKQVHIRQILVDDETKAKDLRRRLDGGANFVDLAKKSSMDEESREAGGDRGFLPLGFGLMDPAVEQAVAGASVGQILGPIATPYGFYLVQFVEIEEQRSLAPEMRQGLMHAAFVTWLEEEKSKAVIERYVTFE